MSKRRSKNTAPKNPATGKAFAQVRPWAEVKQLREEIIYRLRSQFDAEKTTSQNEGHWRMATDLSPNSVSTLNTRRILRNRSRYEFHNNGYLKGIGLTLSNDMVGSGARLQITDPRFTKKQQQIIELRFNDNYASKIKMRRKLWGMRMDKLQSGEAFAFGFDNPIMRHPVRYDYRVYECDQVSSDQTKPITSNNEIDGIRFDKRSGEAAFYHLLNEHPGEQNLFVNLNPFEGEWIKRDQVCHWFRQDRKWLRGVPETVATLPLWALLRRYTLAVVQNAEIAADFTVMLQTMQGANGTPFPLSGGQPTEVDPTLWFQSFPVDRGMMSVLPHGYELKQLNPLQPVTMYDMFVNALVQEASRPLLMPRNLSLGYSGGYNMASGTLDRQLYRGSIDQERKDCSEEVCDHILYNWWYQAIRIADYFDDAFITDASIWALAQENRSLREDPPQHVWRWDEVPEHTDPVKVATAINILHMGGHLSDKDIQEGRFNRSTEEHYANLEEQVAWRKKNMPDEEPAETNSSKSRSGSKIAALALLNQLSRSDQE